MQNPGTQTDFKGQGWRSRLPLLFVARGLDFCYIGFGPDNDLFCEVFIGMLRDHADQIVKEAIASVLPDAAVRRALQNMSFPGRVLLVAAGKAAWQMAKAASECLGSRIENGVVVTKYGHVKGSVANFTCYEAGHPVPDENSFLGTQAALDLTANLTGTDTVLFLLSGGGSALFEKPLIPGLELQGITEQLLACGADITEINTIRKRLSAVKGGRFALHCRPARIEAIVLSDILGGTADSCAAGRWALTRWRRSRS